MYSTIDAPFTSDDNIVWTDKDPDFELVEPSLLVSINRNYMKFGRKVGRPPLSHSLTIVNHGDFPVAFKVQTTDNYAYFVNQNYGIIPGRRVHALPHLRVPNAFTLEVFRRPYDTFSDEQQAVTFNVPQKDRLVILLTHSFWHSVPPQALFHQGTCYDTLRVCLEYTGSPTASEDHAYMYRKAKGWCTWPVTIPKEPPIADTQPSSLAKTPSVASSMANSAKKNSQKGKEGSQVRQVSTSKEVSVLPVRSTQESKEKGQVSKEKLASKEKEPSLKGQPEKEEKEEKEKPLGSAESAVQKEFSHVASTQPTKTPETEA